MKNFMIIAVGLIICVLLAHQNICKVDFAVTNPTNVTFEIWIDNIDDIEAAYDISPNANTSFKKSIPKGTPEHLYIYARNLETGMALPNQILYSPIGFADDYDVTFSQNSFEIEERDTADNIISEAAMILRAISRASGCFF